MFFCFNLFFPLLAHQSIPTGGLTGRDRTAQRHEHAAAAAPNRYGHTLRLETTHGYTYGHHTVTPSDTPIPFTPTNTLPGPKATNTANPLYTLAPTDDINTDYAFTTQGPPEPFSIDSFVENRGCQWMGVAGRVVDISN